jgi:hypothetical protein
MQRAVREFARSVRARAAKMLDGSSRGTRDEADDEMWLAPRRRREVSHVTRVRRGVGP